MYYVKVYDESESQYIVLAEAESWEMAHAIKCAIEDMREAGPDMYIEKAK